MDKLEKRILLIVGAVALVVLAIVLVQRSKEPDVVVNDFTPPPFESAALTGTPEVPDESLYGTLALSDEVSVSLYSSPVVTDGAAQVCFTSLPENEAWVLLRLLDAEGNLLGESGLLRPGEYVESVVLENNPSSPQAIARILTYELDTYYSLGSANAQIILQGIE